MWLECLRLSVTCPRPNQINHVQFWFGFWSLLKKDFKKNYFYNSIIETKTNRKAEPAKEQLKMKVIDRRNLQI